MENRKNLSEPRHAAAARGLACLGNACTQAAMLWLLVGGWTGACGAAGVTLAWDPSPTAGIAGYAVRFGTNTGSYSDFVVVGTNTTATTPALRAGTTYFFVVSAYTQSGLESLPSGELRYTVPGGTPANLPPTLAPLSQLLVPINAGPQVIPLTGIGPGSSAETQRLAITATSSNPALIPAPIVNYLSPAPSGTLTFTPVSALTGTATISVIVNDGQLQNNTTLRSFMVAVGTADVQTIYLEAENGVISSPMRVEAEGSASEGRFVASSADSSGSVTLPVNIVQAGSYGVWCRVLAIDSGTDSFFVSMDGGPEDTFRAGAGGFSTEWQWVQLNGITAGNPRLFSLSRGGHTLTFRGREADTRLDAVYVTSDRTFLPVKLALASVAGLGAGMEISFQAPPGYAFDVQATEDLRVWTTLWRTQSDLQNQWLRWVDESVTASGRRFYRIATR